MTVYYIESEAGSFTSADGKRRFIRLSGKEAYDYLRTEEGKRKRFMRTSRHEEGGETEFVEAPPELIKQHRSSERREQYVSNCIEQSGITTVSLYSFNKDGYSDIFTGENLIADPFEDFCEREQCKYARAKLKTALAELQAEELEIINALYLCKNRLTEAEIAEMKGVSQQAISKRKLRILKKLKTFLDE